MPFNRLKACWVMLSFGLGAFDSVAVLTLAAVF